MASDTGLIEVVYFDFDNIGLDISPSSAPDLVVDRCTDPPTKEDSSPIEVTEQTEPSLEKENVSLMTITKTKEDTVVTAPKTSDDIPSPTRTVPTLSPKSEPVVHQSTNDSCPIEVTEPLSASDTNLDTIWNQIVGPNPSPTAPSSLLSESSTLVSINEGESSPSIEPPTTTQSSADHKIQIDTSCMSVKDRMNALHQIRTSTEIKMEEFREERELHKRESIRLSPTERLKALHHHSATAANLKIDSIKAERNVQSVRLTASSKGHVTKLFVDKVKTQNERAKAACIAHSKCELLKDALKNRDRSGSQFEATEALTSLGWLTCKDPKGNGSTNQKKPEIASKEYTLNMNNNSMMRTLKASEKRKMQDLLCYALVHTKGLRQVQMCNANVNDAFFTKMLRTLSDYKGQHGVKELWLDSNSIGNSGIRKLTQYIYYDSLGLEVIKLSNNRKTISTAVLTELLDSLSRNKTIIKFGFDGFRWQQQRNRRDKYCRRNQRIARQRRNDQRRIEQRRQRMEEKMKKTEECEQRKKLATEQQKGADAENIFIHKAQDKGSTAVNVTDVQSATVKFKSRRKRRTRKRIVI